MVNIIGENLRVARVSKGYSRIKLAELTESKVSENSIYYIEKGVTSPKDSVIRILAKALDIPVSDLVGIKEVSTNELIERLMSRLDDIESKLNKLIDKEVNKDE